MMPDPALVSALSDVRKAYRLLWSYQKRIYDIVELIAGEFEDMGFYWWTPLHSDRPRNSGTNPMRGRWAWDMLPMVRVSYLFLSSNVNPNVIMPGQWMLEVHVNSDSGFEKPDDGTEPDPDTFKAAAESNSFIAIYAWYGTAEASRNWLGGVWKELDWPEKDGEISESIDPPVKVFGKKINLVDLPNRDSVRSTAVAFRNEASAALGITLA